MSVLLLSDGTGRQDPALRPDEAPRWVGRFAEDPQQGTRCPGARDPCSHPDRAARLSAMLELPVRVSSSSVAGQKEADRRTLDLHVCATS
ncbi:hypothetical protein GCM10010245_82650 [Streptomyces spectabilis]|nr:hypothetical protein GCM10010245_82650 [Streptomyces spectabilis]